MKHQESKIHSVPLVIAVTGHRHIADRCVEDIQQQVETELLKIQKTAGRRTPLVLLSMLAEGADYLVAQTALKLGFRLVVVMPMSKELFIKDFTSPLIREKFEGLLDQADTVFSVPLASDITQEDLSEPGEARNIQYKIAGKYIARHSHLLLALWDGKPAQGKGGTEEIVRFAQGKYYGESLKDIDVMSFPPARKIIQIPTTRSGEPTTINVFSHGCDYSDGSDEKRWQGLVAQVRNYNQNCHMYRSKLLEIMEQGYSGIKPNPDDKGHEELLGQFITLDAMAIHFKKKSQLLFQIYFWCLLISGTTLLLFSKGALSSTLRINILLPVYLITIIAASMAALYGNKKKLKNNSLDYRTFAEGLRVQIFWRMAGVSEDVTDHYLHLQREELSWINFAINGINGITSPIAPLEDLDKAHKDWIKDQLTYFKETARKQQKHLGKLNLLTNISLVLGMFYVPLRALSVPFYTYLKEYPLGWIALVCFTVLVGISLSLWGSLKTYVNFTCLREQIIQYTSFETLFSLASKRLEPCIRNNDTPKAKRILFILGKETLSENAGWFLLHRPRQMSTPK